METIVKKRLQALSAKNSQHVRDDLGEMSEPALVFAHVALIGAAALSIGMLFFMGALGVLSL